MSWQTAIISKQEALPPRLVLTGPAGIGKSSFGAALPKPILIDFDKGANELNVDRYPAPKTWADAIKLIQEIAKDPGDYRSLVIDTVDPLEDLAEQSVCEDGIVQDKKLVHLKSVSEYNWGEGYNATAAKWRILLAEIDQVRAKGLLVCLLGHTIVRTAQDPMIGEYDEFTSQLGKKCWAETMRWADFVGFATFDSAPVKDEKRVVVTADRVLFTQRASGIQAKNRYALPPKLPFGPSPRDAWVALDAGIKRHQAGVVETAAEIIARIEKLAAGTPFVEKAKGFVLECKMDVPALRDVENALRAKLSGNGAQASA